LIEGTDIIEGPKLAIQGGAMAIPAGPGLGVTLDHDKLARAHETFVKCGMRGRDDQSLMRRLEPGWKGELL
jgi:glucarate dehydratase